MITNLEAQKAELERLRQWYADVKAQVDKGGYNSDRLNVWAVNDDVHYQYEMFQEIEGTLEAHARALAVVEAVMVLNEESRACPLCGCADRTKTHFKGCPLTWWEGDSDEQR